MYMCVCKVIKLDLQINTGLVANTYTSVRMLCGNIIQVGKGQDASEVVYNNSINSCFILYLL